MGWSFSNAVGYRGFAKIGEIPLLATGGQISLNQDPLLSSGVWGAGYKNAAANIAWAYNYLRLEGNISYELTKGSVWSKVQSFAFTNRTSSTDIELKPDGKNGYKGPGFCSGVSFSCSEGQLVTGDINFIGDAGASDNAITADGSGNNAEAGGYYDKIGGADKVIAYWATSVNGVTDAISWNCSYNSDIQLLKCCDGSVTAPVGADYVLLGDMSGDGSYTIFTLKGDFKPSSYHGIKDLTITIADVGSIKIPKALVSSGSTSIQTGASYITADFNFTAVGDGTGAPISMTGGGDGGPSGSGGPSDSGKS
jgi:hypothetical protein